jgi:hypothetical protein
VSFYLFYFIESEKGVVFNITAFYILSSRRGQRAQLWHTLEETREKELSRTFSLAELFVATFSSYFLFS